MKKSFYIQIISIVTALIAAAGCTSLSDLENDMSNVTTNYVSTTNITVTINNTETNVLVESVVYEPLPTSIWIYVDSGSHSGWTDPQVFWWHSGGSESGSLTKLSNYNDGYVNWWVFRLDDVNVRQQYGMKVREGSDWSSPEPIKTENGSYYDRIVTFPVLTKVAYSSVTNDYPGGYSNVVSLSYGTYDKVYIYPPANWYESFIYLMENETNLFADPPGQSSSWLWDQYLGANYWGGGITMFTFYAPNVRRVWVAGDFSDWQKIPMKLSTGRIFWWASISNTTPGDAYKFVIEKYQYTNHHWISDPAAKKNEYSPAMDTAGNRSFVIDQGAYTWQNILWSRPGFDYYIIYQMHVRTFATNNPGNYYGWGTFDSATNRFDYISGLGFTCVEPLPIQEFAGDQSWGYNYVLFYAPESSYCGTSAGDVDSLKRFVDAAHGRGMAVVLDLVFNHMGASDDVVGSFDPALDWNNPSTYWYSGKTDWGPRFNYANPVIAKFLTDSAKYLLQHYKVDGFRFDATYYIHYNGGDSSGRDFLSSMTYQLHSFDANAILIAENLPTDSWITGSGGFNFQWESGMSSELKKLFYDGTTSFSVGTVAGYLSTGSRVLYMTSHDECANGKERTAADLHYVRGSWGNSEYDAQCQQITGLATILMGPARPMMFMGDEFLEGYYDDSDYGPPYNARYFVDYTPLSWNFIYTNRSDSYDNRWGAYYTMKAVQELTWHRRNNASISYYSMTLYEQNDTAKVLSFMRGGDIYVIINYAKTSYSGYGISFPTSDTWNLIFAHPSSAYGQSWADSYLTGSVSGSTFHTIKIPEYGVLVYKKS